MLSLPEERSHSHAFALSGVFVLALAMTAFIGHVVGISRDGALHDAAPPQATSGNLEKNRETPDDRRARRVRARLERDTGRSYSVQAVQSALDRRERLLKSTVTVNVADPASTMTGSWTLSLQRYPWLLEVQPSFGRPSFALNTEAFTHSLRNGAFKGSNPVRDAYITDIRQDQDVLRAESSDTAKPGFVYDDVSIEAIVRQLMETGTGTVALNAAYRNGDVYLERDGERTKLSLLSSGRSNFTNSPEARETNVYKAIDEHVNNVVVHQGEIFSFNATLGGPVTLDKGWVEALGLFGGGSAMTPGGGICQAATTVYRAAVLAGLPIVYKRNHSLYVTYYEQYGVGIDATIFPGVHDLLFRNDSPDTIVLQSYIENEDVFVNIYGIPDGRTVAVDGPYFATTRPRPAELRPLGYQDIGWVQRITYADGRVQTSPIISHYAKPVPSYLARTYEPGISDDMMHAAAKSETPAL